jgi:transposase
MKNTLFSIQSYKNEHYAINKTPSYNLDKNRIRSTKVKIYPNKKQQSILKQWFGTCRYVHNRTIANIKSGVDTQINFIKLRNKYVTEKNNTICNQWEFETPKDVRAGVMKSIETNYKSAFTNLRKKNIKKFEMGFKKKRNLNQSILISKSAISMYSDRKTKKNPNPKKERHFKIYSRFLGKKIRCSNDKKVIRYLKSNGVEHDCTLTYDGLFYYLHFSFDKQPIYPMLNESCGLDPGGRNFQTVFSNAEIIRIQHKKVLIKKLQDRMDLLRSWKAKGELSNSKFIVHFKRAQRKLNNCIDDMQYKLIKLLLKSYTNIYIGELNIKQVTSQLSNKKANRDLYMLKHYTFKQRILNGSSSYHNVQFVNESYTTKTCTLCGTLNHDIGSNKVFKCMDETCSNVIDRDLNGARNILLKYSIDPPSV